MTTSAEMGITSVECIRARMAKCRLARRLLRQVERGRRLRRRELRRRQRVKPHLWELRVHRQGVRERRRVRLQLSITARMLGL
jgi:hypothetical protein